VRRTGHLADRLRDERGVAAVEFALIAGLLFMLVFGMIVFGIIFSRYQTFQSAAREGARVRAVGGSEAAVLAAIQDAAGSDFDQITGSISIGDCPDPADTPDASVQVSWSQSFDIDIPLLPSMTRTAEISGSFRCEQESP
jgi:Flp pilus assembly protein TadG